MGSDRYYWLPQPAYPGRWYVGTNLWMTPFLARLHMYRLSRRRRPRIGANNDY